MIVTAAIPLAPWCTLGVGGRARWFCDAPDARTVIDALGWARDQDLAVYVLGGGSNVVFADDGFAGLVLRVAVGGLSRHEEGERVTFRVGAGEPWDAVVAVTVNEGCAGLECLSGIPGLAGGTPIQNVGAYGQEVSRIIRQVQVVDRAALHELVLPNEACGFAYRTSRFKREDRDRFIVTGVDFTVRRGAPPTLTYADVVEYFRARGEPAPTVAAVREAVLTIRRSKGMVIEAGNPANRSVGSFWVNPVVAGEQFERLQDRHDAIPHFPAGPDRVKVPAAWLIERAGFPRGFRRGAVGISPFQSQAIVNLGGARAADIVSLALDVKRAVWEAFTITLVPEPVFAGFAPAADLDWLVRSTTLDLDPRTAEP